MNITTHVSGQTARIAGNAWMPSQVGIEVSSSTRSGSWRITRLIAWSPSAPSPTTSKLTGALQLATHQLPQLTRVVNEYDGDGDLLRERHV